MMKFLKILKDKNQYIIHLTLIFLVITLIFFTFKPLLFLIFFIILNEIMRFIKRNTNLKFGFEHVTITAVVMGHITNIPFGLFSLIIMIFMKEIRNEQFGFRGLGIKSFFWIVILFISHFLVDFSFSTVGITLVTIRFLIFDFFIPVKYGSAHDLHWDTISWFYNAFAIKILSYLI